MLYDRYKSMGLVVLRIDTKESRETIIQYLEKNPLNVPVLLDAKNKVGSLLGVWVHPTSYLVDRKGMIQYRAIGAVDWMGVEALSIIERLIGEK
jgi:peroxiredoxin